MGPGYASRPKTVKKSHDLARAKVRKQPALPSAMNTVTNIKSAVDANDLTQSSEGTFPEALKEPILRKVQFSTVPRLDTLIDLVFDTYKQDYFPGEVVVAQLEGRKQVVLIRDKTKLAELTFPDGFRRPASARYGIELCDNDQHRESPSRQTIDEVFLMRERGAFTKVMLKTFLKNAITRETWIGAPWTAKEALAKKYRLDTNIPSHLHQSRQHKNSAVSNSGTTTKESKGATSVAVETSGLTKALIEDLDLPTSKLVRPQLNLKCAISGPLVQLFLETWAFFNVFLEVLMLDSFTLDDFEEALDSREPCELMNELFCSVLKAYVDSESAVAEHPLDPEIQSENDVQSYPVHQQADDILAVVGDWRTQLNAKDLAGDNFIGVVLGIACHLSKEPRNAFCLVILDYMLSGEVLERKNVAAKFRCLPANLKLQLLGALVETIWLSALVRQYIEECMENLTQLRKQRTIANQEKKIKTDAIYRLRLRMRAQYPRIPGNAQESKKGKAIPRIGLDEQDASSKLDSSDVEMEEDEENDKHLTDGKLATANKRTSNRLSRTSLEHEIDDTKHQQSPLEIDTEGTFQSRSDYEVEIAKIKRSVQRTEDKIERLEEEFRESDAQRLRRLGQDRFYNQYFFLESCGMPVFGLPNCSTSHANYATGKIFVQGPSKYALEELEQRTEQRGIDYARRKTEEEGETSLAPGYWGFYDDADQVNALLDWLNPRGQRESKLRTAIEQRGELIAQSMEHRAAYLSGEPPSERRSTRNYDSATADRPRFQVWKNTIARKALGSPHSGDRLSNGPMVEKKRKR